jgi:ADP-heptose:LPS heptosyltransferase
MIGVDQMRFLDRYAGLRLCWLLSVLRFLTRPFLGTRLPSPRRVLIIKFSEMGSTVLALPALAALREKVPGLELFFLTFQPNRPVADAMIPPVRVFPIDVSSPWRMLQSGRAAIWRLRHERIDTTIDMDFFSRLSAVVAFAVCRGNRVGFDRFTGEGLGRGRLLTHPVMYSPHVHQGPLPLQPLRLLSVRLGVQRQEVALHQEPVPGGHQRG